MIDIQQFEREGFAIEPSLLTSVEVHDHIAHLEANARPQPGRGGVRDIMTPSPRYVKSPLILPSASSSMPSSVPKPSSFAPFFSIRQRPQTGRCRGIRTSPSPYKIAATPKATVHGPQSPASSMCNRRPMCSHAWSPFASISIRVLQTTALYASYPKRNNSVALTKIM
jgi:hypothetical protein